MQTQNVQTCLQFPFIFQTQYLLLYKTSAQGLHRQNFLNKHKILTDSQYRFRKKRVASVETNDAVLNLKGRRHIGMQD